MVEIIKEGRLHHLLGVPYYCGTCGCRFKPTAIEDLIVVDKNEDTNGYGVKCPECQTQTIMLSIRLKVAKEEITDNVRT